MMRLFKVLVLGVVAPVLVVAVLGCGTKTNPNDSLGGAVVNAITAPQSKYAVSIDNLEIQNEKYGDGLVAVVTYTFTNNSDQNNSFWLAIEDQVFQGGIELKSSLFDWDDNYMSDLKPGATLTLSMGYTLLNITDPIKIECFERGWGSTLLLAEKEFSFS